jgi:hypothetical protein
MVTRKKHHATEIRKVGQSHRTEYKGDDESWASPEAISSSGDAESRQVEQEMSDEVQPLANPNLARSHVQTMAVMDFGNQNKFTLPGLPGALTWVQISQTWARHDIIRVAGL